MDRLQGEDNTYTWGIQKREIVYVCSVVFRQSNINSQSLSAQYTHTYTYTYIQTLTRTPPTHTHTQVLADLGAKGVHVIHGEFRTPTHIQGTTDVQGMTPLTCEYGIESTVVSAYNGISLLLSVFWDTIKCLLFIYLSIYPSIYLFVCMLVCMYVCMYTCIYVCLSVLVMIKTIIPVILPLPQ